MEGYNEDDEEVCPCCYESYGASSDGDPNDK
jgi:hypothetical protein